MVVARAGSAGERGPCRLHLHKRRTRSAIEESWNKPDRVVAILAQTHRGVRALCRMTGNPGGGSGQARTDRPWSVTMYPAPTAAGGAT
jgi:hypothetical protein